MERFYQSQDMAKISCSKCKGCGECCHGMGDTIHLDPYDMHLMITGLHQPFAELLDWRIALHVEDGMILPHLKMQETTGGCGFLREDGLCGIHAFRPGICRLFPLGRNYRDGKFDYFIVDNSCPMPGKTKVKISKWLDIPELERNEAFVADWHGFVRRMQERLMHSGDDDYNRKMNMFLLQTFYIDGFDAKRDFYDQYEERMQRVQKIFAGK